MTKQADVLIVGCGLAGLMAAQTLQEAGHKVQIVDKGRGVGGRMATRRIGPGRLDHGAQFFTARTPIMQALVDDWLAQGLAYVWTRSWAGQGSADATTLTNSADGHPRYAIKGGMNALAKHLAQDLSIQRQCKIDTVSPTDSGWRLQAEGGQTFTAPALLLTAPVSQSLAMLSAGQTPLADADRTALNAIRYSRCICGLFWLEGDIDLPDVGAVQNPNGAEGVITWIADNQRKGISPEARLVIVHTSQAYSQQNWDADRSRVLADLEARLRPFLAADTRIREAQYHRWGFAQALQCHPAPTLQAQNLPPLFFAGDAFGNAPRVEGAILSGLAAAEAMGV